MDSILEIKNLVKSYGSGEAATKALNDVSFTMKQGEFTAVMGASGSGKSTLLNLIATIDRATSGKIVLEGRNVAGFSEKELSEFRRDRLGFIFQDYNLLETLTVAENIILPLNLQKKPVKETKKGWCRWRSSWKSENSLENSQGSCPADSGNGRHAPER